MGVMRCDITCGSLAKMNVITIANLKGGVGKTTTAVYLAMISARSRSTVLIDADPQGSAAEWIDELPALPHENSNLPEIIEAPSARTLRNAILKVGDRLAIIDTPPGNPEIVMTAIEAASIVLIPTRAGILEVPRVALTLRLIPTNTPRSLVIAAANPRTRAHRETLNAWTNGGEHIAGVVNARTAIAANSDLDPQAWDEYSAILEISNTRL